MGEGIALSAVLAKATTTVDGGWNLTFSVPQSEVAQILQISALRDVALKLVVIPDSFDSTGFSDG